MALTDAFLTTCRTAIVALPELTAFRAAIAPMSSRAVRVAAWYATYTPPSSSLAYQLRVAIRNAILAAQTGAQGPLDLESAYNTLAAQYAPEANRPLNDTEVAAQVAKIIPGALP